MKSSSFKKKLLKLNLLVVCTAAIGCIGVFNNYQTPLMIVGLPGSFITQFPLGDIEGFKADWKFYLEVFSFAAIINMVFYSLIFCLYKGIKIITGKLFRKKLEPTT